jgi:hypothetical protein
MPIVYSHTAPSALIELAGLIEDMAARRGSEYDPVLDDLEREFAELRCQPGHA